MTKKLITTIAFMLLLFYSFIPLAAATMPELSVDGAIAIEVETGTILFEQNADEQLGIASLTKLMNVYIFLEEATAQGIKLTDTYPISAHAANLKTQAVDISGVYFYEGQEVTVQKLLELTLVFSDNGAAIALAEIASGSEQAHVDKMNAQAQEWGLENTIFYNVSGLTMYNYGDEMLPGSTGDEYNKSTAREMAYITRELVLKYPQVLEITQMETVEYNGETLYSYNQMLPSGTYYYPGVTGMKTGTEDEAGACFISYYTHEGINYITVVLGADNTEQRYSETAYMLDWIQEVQMSKIFSTVEFDVPIEGSTYSEVTLVPQNDVYLIEGQTLDLQIEKLEYNSEYFNSNNRQIKDIPQGEEVMTITLTSLSGETNVKTVENSETLEIVLVAQEEVSQQGFVGDLMDATQLFFNELFNSIIKT